MSFVQHVRAYLIFDWRILMREPMVLFFAFILPVVMYAVLGSMFGNAVYADGASYYDQYTSSFIGVILLTVALFNVGPPFVIYKEMGFFKSLAITPLSSNSIISGIILRCMLILLVGIVEVIIVGWMMFDRLPPLVPFQILFVIIIASFCLFSFGFALGCLAKSAGAAYGMNMVVFQVMLMLSGASVPLEQFPEFIAQASILIPMTHVVEGLRLAWKGELFTAGGLMVLLVMIVFGAACTFFANRKFSWYVAA